MFVRRASRVVGRRRREAVRVGCIHLLRESKLWHPVAFTQPLQMYPCIRFLGPHISGLTFSDRKLYYLWSNGFHDCFS